MPSTRTKRPRSMSVTEATDTMSAASVPPSPSHPPPAVGRTISADFDRTVPVSGLKTKTIPFTSVVKVFCVTARPNYLQPWQMNRQESCTGSAFHIEGNMLLTNAHVVRDYTTVRVRRHGGSDKFQATVLSINHACDLALLTVTEEKFWTGMSPLHISKKIPQLYENAMVIGYPLGGDNVCVTRGVVSRVTTLPYEDSKFFLSNQELVAVQLDAAINSGNSGGPALDEAGRIVGVAFSGYAGSADNIGYIIPYPVINNFLAQFKLDPTVSRVCDFGMGYMLCENPSLRDRHKVLSPHTGVLVTKVAPLGAAHKGGIKEDDVILSIDGCKIANDGSIDFRQDERLSWQHKVGDRLIGSVSEVEILRNGKVKTVNIMGAPTPELVPRHRVVGTAPTYLIVGGVVFTPLTCGLLDVAVEALSEEAWQRGRGAKKHDDEEVIVVISVLGDPINHGYEINRLPLLQKFNGKDVRNMKELKAKVDAIDDGFLHFLLGDGKSMILDAKKCRETEEEIFKTYAVPSACSRDLLPADDSKATNGHVTITAITASPKKAFKQPKKATDSKKKKKEAAVLGSVASPDEGETVGASKVGRSAKKDDAATSSSVKRKASATATTRSPRQAKRRSTAAAK